MPRAVVLGPILRWNVAIPRREALESAGRHLRSPGAMDPDRQSHVPFWIRFENYARFHAVYQTLDSEYRTYCGRAVLVEHVVGRTPTPPARCACCRSRLALPYLVPKDSLVWQRHR